MTGFELDGRTINVREDVQEKGRREARREAGGAELKQPWLDKEWSRVAGSGDEESSIDEKEVGELIASRDAARAEASACCADLSSAVQEALLEEAVAFASSNLDLAEAISVFKRSANSAPSSTGGGSLTTAPPPPSDCS